MNNLKLILHRAAQTAVVTTICAVAFNLFYVSLAYEDGNIHFDFDWNWIIAAVSISTFCAACYVSCMKFPALRLSSSYIEPVGEVVIGIGVGLAYTITYGIHSVNPIIPLWIAAGAIVITAIIALFWSEVGRSLVFALFFASTIGIFTCLYYSATDGWENGLFTLLMSVVVVVLSRILRWVWIILFVKDHSYMKVVEKK